MVHHGFLSSSTLHLIEEYKLGLLLFVCSCFILLACSENSTEDVAKNRSKFQKAESTGVTFSNNISSTKELNILNYLYFYNGAGTAIGDFNNDGLDDIYFVSNQEEDALYLNRKNLKFEPTQASVTGLKNDTGWSTGVTTVDINNDGLLDVYISKVSGHLDLKGANKLYVNQGIDDNGYPYFKDEAVAYGLNIEGFNSQAAFFDYDLDGDLDVFILKHSLYPNSNYGRGSIRKTTDSLAGDQLLENVNGRYVDASAKSGIFSSRIGYGLGISIGDLNADGYPDIYIGNDFFENDYLYINQKDGTFKEINSTESALGHSSHFSMGNAIADVNNDLRPDIFSVDMLPENLETFKASGQEYNYSIFQNQLKYGYEPQFMQNTLHLNLGNSQFTETAFLSGIAATEWSWAPLVADFDNDGLKDIYVTNGILGATNDMDFVNFTSNDKVQKKLGGQMDDEGLSFIRELPEKKTANYFFKNKGNAQFENAKESWFDSAPSFSNGASYGDLDNDGDLDIVVNNVNEPALILKNTTSTDTLASRYIKLKFNGPPKNTSGIGAQVFVYSGQNTQFFENYPTIGYLSSVASGVSVGLGEEKTVDSLRIVWPDRKIQVLKNSATQQTLVLNYTDAQAVDATELTLLQPTSLLTNASIPIDFKHTDDLSIEFARDPLVPYATTNLSGTVITGDINTDGRQDLIALGGKRQETLSYLQQEDGSFKKRQLPDGEVSAINEDVGAVIFDANGDGLNDLLIVSGGNEFRSGTPLLPRLYISGKNGLERDRSQFTSMIINASTVATVDLDNDDDMDVIITSNVLPHQFGKTPAQYIFENDGDGKFIDVTSTFASEFQKIGNVYSVSWQDIDGNGFPDAVVAGHWMPISIFLNDGKRLSLQKTEGLENTNGWWNTVKIADFDKDGDLDIIAGNFGLNTRLQPSVAEPVRLYRNDFDSNGQIDPVVTYYHQGVESTIATKDEMVKQLPYLNKKFLSYTAFAKAEINELLGAEKLTASEKKEAYQFASMYFENLGNNSFKNHPLPFIAQASTVQDILVEDVNNDGFLDALLVGNNSEISTQLGRLDGSHGVFLENDQNGGFIVLDTQELDISGSCRSIEGLEIQGQKYYVVGRNNNTPIFLKTLE